MKRNIIILTVVYIISIICTSAVIISSFIDGTRRGGIIWFANMLVIGTFSYFYLIHKEKVKIADKRNKSNK